MKSLFLRIFLWFWLAMAAVVVVLVVTSPLFTRSRPGLEDWQREAEDWARGRLDRVTLHVERVGIDDLPMERGHGRGRGRGGRPPSPARIFVADEEGNILRGGEAPPEVRDLSLRALSQGSEVIERTGMLYLVARPAEDPEGRRLAIVAAHHSPPRLVHLMEPKALAWRLGILFLVVGGLSFWLARTLSSPVAPLRRATRRLSNGDLSARAGERATRRRDEIGELARDFDAMAERIEALVGSQQRLLRDVSHELRSPLARLVVALELARSKTGGSAVRELDRIEREAGRLDDLIGQLLLLQRLEGGLDDGEGEEIDLAELVAGVVDDAGFEAADQSRDIRFAPGGQCRMIGRRKLLRSAIENVVRNAVLHTPAGTSVDVALELEGRAVEISVRDHGPGVAESELEHIFEPFHRIDEARERAGGGAGLGLAIARRAIEAHGGTLTAGVHAGGGLEVVATLPVPDLQHNDSE